MNQSHGSVKNRARSSGAYLVLSLLAALALVILLAGILARRWGVAFCADVATALLMEGRVHFGERTAHDGFFYVHLVFAFLLAASLLVALSMTMAGWSAFSSFFVWVCVVPTAVAGAVLWYRGLEQTLQHS